MDYGDRRNAVVSTASKGPNENERRRWHVVGAYELGPSGIIRIKRILVGFRLNLPPRETADCYFVQLARDYFVI